MKKKRIQNIQKTNAAVYIGLYIKCGTLQIDAAGPHINIKRRLGSIAYTILLYLYLHTQQHTQVRQQ